ncbi:MAG: hemolysin family protein [Lachnospiraceae bacterium]|nr:hemolysin family protein [Lachnospiraceae bacterium]
MGSFTDFFSGLKKKLGNTSDVTEEDIMSMVAEGHEQGVFLATEAKMIQNVFAFNDKAAKDIMTHRNDIVALDGEKTLEETIHVFENSHYSRFPVYLGNLDNIIGTIHMKEMFSFCIKKDDYARKIRDIDGLMRKAEFVPETHSIHTLFSQMQLQKTHLYIVIDEYGQTSGLITLEDILEEIVGNILDEHDDEHGMIEEAEEGAYIMDGKTPLDEVAGKLSIEFEEDDIETLSGFMIYRYGSIPEDDESVTVDAYGYRFEAVETKGHIILKAKVIPFSE